MRLSSKKKCVNEMVNESVDTRWEEKINELRIHMLEYEKSQQGVLIALLQLENHLSEYNQRLDQMSE